MDTLGLIQGSQEWKLARVGSVETSRIGDVTARTKSGYGASRSNYAAEIVCELLTGNPTEGFVSLVMQNGKLMEPEARAAYCFYTDCTVTEIGLVKHPTILNSHASPDGLIGDDGLLELKCPQPAQHLSTILGEQIADKYIKQVQWQLACCVGRKWVDWVSYCPAFPENMRLFIRRILRDSDLIKMLEQNVIEFIAEVDATVATLNERYALRAAA